MAPSDTAIRALKPQATKQKLFDSEGLQLWILPTGTKVWRYAYRYADSQKTLALGQYPLVGLADAREWRDAAKAQLASGIDPSHHRKARIAS